MTILRKTKCEICGGIANYSDKNGPSTAERMCGCSTEIGKLSDIAYVPTRSEQEAYDQAFALMRAGYDALPERSRRRLSLHEIDVLTKPLRQHYTQAEYQRRAAVEAYKKVSE